MKLKYIFLFSATLLVGTSCSDFLDKEPISDNVDGNFFTAENQLEPYCNNMYGLLCDSIRSQRGFQSLIVTTCTACCPITAQVRVLSGTSLRITTVMT